MKYTHITDSRKNKYRITQPGDTIFFFHNISLDLDIVIGHSLARAFIYGLYTGENSEKFKLRTCQHHTAPGSYSELLVKGALDHNSSLHYSGSISIEKNCNGSHAYQKNQILLLSPNARVTTQPNLEIRSPDVFCTHGSTTGRINTDQLHYMHCKGLSDLGARKLFIQGFISDLVSKIKVQHPKFIFKKY
ncbi:MAG: SufD family Fe-S cluster assembly protein [Candidatus Roizmanbacteria bacterium]